MRIGSNTVLPARREPVTLVTADGLHLPGELALPAADAPRHTIVCLHPLPTHGGSMDSHLLRKMAWRLPALAGIAVLRFNTRGTAGAPGAFDHGAAEGRDLAAALELVEFRDLPDVWLVGWSFGTDVVLRHGTDPAVRGAVLLSPPLRTAGAPDLLRWAAFGRPVRVVVPEFDDYLPPAEAHERFRPLTQAEVVDVPAAHHLFVGRADDALDLVVGAIDPAAVPLPRHWPPDAPGAGPVGAAAPVPGAHGPVGVAP